MHVHPKPVFLTAVLALAWIAALFGGLHELLRYERGPGVIGAVPTAWPAETSLERSQTGATLVMLAHPHCPCTTATVAELARIMAQMNGRVAAYVLFLKPRGAAPDWDDTALRHQAAAIPGVTVLTDIDGMEAARFGAQTSGHTLLFDHTGELLFNGGITASRGHAGDNLGENAIVALVNDRVPGTNRTLVFGCSLSDSLPKEAQTLCRR